MTKKGPWIKVRKPISKYPETPQQRNVRIGGAMIQARCKGLKDKDFTKCRSEVLQCAFHEDKCDIELNELKDEVKEKIEEAYGAKHQGARLKQEASRFPPEK